VKFIAVQFSPCSVFLHFRSKYPSAPFSQKPSCRVPSSKWETKFCTHTAWPAKLQCCMF
jgi:hypothetical protein